MAWLKRKRSDERIVSKSKRYLRKSRSRVFSFFPFVSFHPRFSLLYLFHPRSLFPSLRKSHSSTRISSVFLSLSFLRHLSPHFSLVIVVQVKKKIKSDHLNAQQTNGRSHGTLTEPREQCTRLETNRIWRREEHDRTQILKKNHIG